MAGRRTGYDPAYGARPLRRLVQSAIGDPLARLLIGGEVVDGEQVTVDHVDGAPGSLQLTGRMRAIGPSAVGCNEPMSDAEAKSPHAPAR